MNKTIIYELVAEKEGLKHTLSFMNSRLKKRVLSISFFFLDKITIFMLPNSSQNIEKIFRLLEKNEGNIVVEK